jgi:hypothetical protein
MTGLNPIQRGECVNLGNEALVMSSVLEFALRPRDKNSARATEGTAEIIIFPGVRFERLDFDADIFEPDEPQSPGAGHSVTRKRAAKS